MIHRPVFSSITAALIIFGVSCSRISSPPLASAGRDLAGIVAHTRSAEMNVQRAKSHASSVGKAYLETASAEHHAILASAVEVEKSLIAAQKEADESARLKSDRWVKTALALKRLWLVVKIAIGIWILFGLIGAWTRWAPMLTATQLLWSVLSWPIRKWRHRI